MHTLGIDVSHWEGAIDWQVAAPAIGFAYFKCTDGIRYVDEQFLNNQRGCSEAGIPHAPYHYFQPSHDPIAQAHHFIHTAGLEYKRYILDVEKQVRDPGIVSHLRLFLDKVEELTGIKPAIYTSAGYWNDFVKPTPAWAKNYDLMVANYTLRHQPVLPAGWEEYKIWQFSDYFFTPGCNAACDGNWFNGTLESARNWFGNYKSSESQSPTSGMQMRSHFDHLNIRQGPSMNARDVGDLMKGETVQVEELGGCDVWIKHSRGWSAVEIAGYRYMSVVPNNEEISQDVEVVK
jgi:lysozyme